MQLYVCDIVHPCKTWVRVRHEQWGSREEVGNNETCLKVMMTVSSRRRSGSLQILVEGLGTHLV